MAQIEFGPNGPVVRAMAKAPGLVADQIELAVIDGRNAVVGLRVRVEPEQITAITSDRLRLIPLADLALIASSETGGGPPVIDDDSWQRHPAFQALHALDRIPDSPGEMPTRPRGGGREYSDAVAVVVRAARKRRENVAATLARVTGLSVDRANQLIREARDLGALPPDWKSEPVKKLSRRPASRRQKSEAKE
jgi:hypothetical protein